MLTNPRDKMFYVNRVNAYLVLFRDKREFQSKIHLTPASKLILKLIKVI